MKRMFFALLATVLALSVAALAWSQHRRVAEDDVTTYAARFSTEKFLEIRYGARADDVRDILGAPLSTWSNTLPETWQYACPGDDVFTIRNTGETEQAVLDRDEAMLEFNQRGEVEKIKAADAPEMMRLVHVGDDRGKVVALLGEPCVKRPAGTLVTWRYSAARRDDGYWFMATVVFNDANRVVDKKHARVDD